MASTNDTHKRALAERLAEVAFLTPQLYFEPSTLESHDANVASLLMLFEVGIAPGTPMLLALWIYFLKTRYSQFCCDLRWGGDLAVEVRGYVMFLNVCGSDFFS